MKKFLLVVVILIIILLFSGCGYIKSHKAFVESYDHNTHILRIKNFNNLNNNNKVITSIDIIQDVKNEFAEKAIKIVE